MFFALSNYSNLVLIIVSTLIVGWSLYWVFRNRKETENVWTGRYRLGMVIYWIAVIGTAILVLAGVFLIGVALFK